MKKLPGEPILVRLVWDDAWSDTKEVSPESSYYEREWVRVAAGFLKSTNEREVVICRDWDNDNDDEVSYAGCIRVPRGMVKSLTALGSSRRLLGSSGRSVSKSSSPRKKRTAK